MGTGTGALTVSLCEQGATVTAVDVDQPSLEIAKVKCDAYGSHPRFTCQNAVDIQIQLEEKFDLIDFRACIEHMTYVELIASLRIAIDRMNARGSVAILGAPN